MLSVVNNVKWPQRKSNNILYDNLPRINITIATQRLSFARHCFRSEEVVHKLILWEPNVVKILEENQLEILSTN